MPAKRRVPLDILTPEQRRQELASILSMGVLRWARRVRAAGLAETQETSPQGQIPLDLPGDLRLSVLPRTAG
jgi:hypothetical protein